MKNKRIKFSDGLKKGVVTLLAVVISGCAAVQYQPLPTINQVQPQSGYRLQNEMKRLAQKNDDDVFMVLLFSGGGTRAAALGYGVLEQLNKQKVWINGKEGSLLQNVDMVFGVSGGSVLAAYFALHGKETIPLFERHFLKQNFQRLFARQVFSMANLPRLTSPQFGRGDLLAEQFERVLFGRATFGDLAQHRKGPFAVISATDMGIGHRLSFTQEYFDAMCLNLSDLSIARAVAASSAVPLVFSPITLNNYGGHCGYSLPKTVQQEIADSQDKLEVKNKEEISAGFKQYENSDKRPYIHLLDGGLTDNLGLRSLLDIAEVYPDNLMRSQFEQGHIRKVVVISVNAQNKLSSDIDKSADIPGIRDVSSAIIDIPIDRTSQESLRSFRSFADEWNNKMKRTGGQQVGLYFVSLNLLDLPKSQLRENALNIPTTFYLPRTDINDLKESARVLMQNSKEYQRLLADLSVKPVKEKVSAKPIWFVGEGPVRPEAQSAQYDALFQ